VMKLLASITIVVSLPTMVASFYGMNVDLPLSGHAWAFVAIIGIALLMSLFSVFVFWKRDWF